MKMAYIELEKTEYQPLELAGLILNNIDDYIFLFDSAGKLIFFNKSAEELMSGLKKDWRELYYTELFVTSKDLIALIQKGLVEERLFHCKDINLEFHGNINVDVSIFPFHAKNRVEGIIVSIRKNLSIIDKDDFHFDSLLTILSAIAHEIKNPLTGIKGAAQLLKELETNQDSRQYADFIMREVNRLDSILSDYLSLTLKPVLSDLDIHEVIEQALQVMGSDIKDKKIIVERFYDPSLPNIKGDASKLLQVFINLIKNAIEAMAKTKRGRKLSITTKPAKEYMVFYGNSTNRNTPSEPRKQRWIMITFEDTGEGISRENLSKIFLPFFSLKTGGTGLGLALSKKIIRDHGGTLMALPKSKKGALFKVYLPF
ncbi:MAG: ATP-binding protein [Thermodesulfovibrionales bacterium]|nr:ATP-binding protein [Thermodesulfovibrionales bacterium]